MMESDIKAAIGKRVQALRKRRRISQDELALAIEKSVETISNIERGISAPRVGTAMDIANALGVSFTDIFKIPPGNTDNARHLEAMDHLSETMQGCDAKTLDAAVEAVEFVKRIMEGKPPLETGSD